MRNRIIEKIVEPSKIEVGSTFMIKVKIDDILKSAKIIISENNKVLITEDNKPLRTDWGD